MTKRSLKLVPPNNQTDPFKSPAPRDPSLFQDDKKENVLLDFHKLQQHSQYYLHSSKSIHCLIMKISKHHQKWHLYNSNFSKKEIVPILEFSNPPKTKDYLMNLSNKLIFVKLQEYYCKRELQVFHKLH